jgi:hypothetical protein
MSYALLRPICVPPCIPETSKASLSYGQAAQDQLYFQLKVLDVSVRKVCIQLSEFFVRFLLFEHLGQESSANDKTLFAVHRVFVVSAHARPTHRAMPNIYDRGHYEKLMTYSRDVHSWSIEKKAPS